MNYEVYITDAAERDLNEAVDYIEFVLLNPQAAEQLLEAAGEKLSTLAHNATGHAVVDDPVLRAWGIRFLQVNHYLAFYTVAEKERRVYVVRFLYAKRDWFNVLKLGIAQG